MKYKFCPQCGQQIPMMSVFCPNCGFHQTNGRNNVVDKPASAQAQTDSKFSKGTTLDHKAASHLKVNKTKTTPQQKNDLDAVRCTYKQAWLAFWFQYAKGHGLSSRNEFWEFILMNSGLWVILVALTHLAGDYFPTFGMILKYLLLAFALGEVIPFISLIYRRSRDAGIKPGLAITSIVFLFIPPLNIIAIIAIFVYSLLASDQNVRLSYRNLGQNYVDGYFRPTKKVVNGFTKFVSTLTFRIPVIVILVLVAGISIAYDVKIPSSLPANFKHHTFYDDASQEFILNDNRAESDFSFDKGDKTYYKINGISKTHFGKTYVLHTVDSTFGKHDFDDHQNVTLYKKNGQWKVKGII